MRGTLLSQNKIVFGNLQAYKMFVRPTANKLYGTAFMKTKDMTIHQQTVRNMLSIMVKNEPLTIWDMAKVKLAGDDAKLRYREKKYRRLLVGREDRGKHTAGILELGLVVKDGKSYKKIPADKYRLSLHGVLYCINALRLTEKEIDGLAKKYQNVLPKVFGKWNYLKSYIKNDLYTIKLLAKGLIADNPQIITNSKTPFYELMSYVTIKYHRNYESISETELAEQISYWFYVNLMYQPYSKTKKQYVGFERLDVIFEGDTELKKWFISFDKDGKKEYKNRHDMMKIKPRA